PAADPPKHTLLAMGLPAALCIRIGVYPATLYKLLPFEVDYVAYNVTHVLTQLQLLGFAGLAFVWLNISKLEPHDMPSVNIDVEWLYRKFLPCSVRCAIAALKPRSDAALGLLRAILEKNIVGNLTR